MEPRFCRCSAPSVSAGRRGFEARIEVNPNVTNTQKFANPTSSFTSGNFMRVLALNPSVAGRQVRLAARYSS